MKIAHFTSGKLSGGAARGAYFLHKSLEEQGLESVFYISDKDELNLKSDVNYLSKGTKSTLLKYRNGALEKFILNYYNKKEQDLFSLGLGIYDNEIIEISRHVDVVHFHWINDQMISLEAIRQIKVPIVWTLRDMWPISGGCHYSKNCFQFIDGCGNCPLLNSNNSDDITRWVYNRKMHNIHSNVYPVAISNWLKELAIKSKLFSSMSVTMIPNCIDTNEFIQYEKERVRREFGLPKDKKIVLYGAINSFSDQRKGFELLRQALIRIKEKEKYHLVSFGDSQQDTLKELGYSYTNFGKINNDTLLSKVYSSADVFVAPSIEEAFGKTIVESMSCGTPVVAFDATGPKDIISHKINGYLARPYEVEDLALGISWVTNNDSPKILSQDSRKQVIEKFSFDVVSKKYLKLYNDILSNSNFQHKNEILSNTHYINDLNEYEYGFEKFLVKQFAENNHWYIFDKIRLMDILLKTKDNKVAIYGTGSYGKEMLHILKGYNIEVDCFIDSNQELHGTYINSLMIKHISECTNHFIFVASTWYEEIKKTLLNFNFKNDEYVICKK